LLARYRPTGGVCSSLAPHQLLESAWYFTALDDATEAKLSAIVRKAAS
jgi:hypothetical protein